MKRLGPLSLLFCLAAAPATQPERPVTYTLEQIIRAVPKSERPTGSGEWTEAQVKRYGDAIAAVVLGKKVTLKGLTVVEVKPVADATEVTAGSGWIKGGGLNAALTGVGTLTGASGDAVSKASAGSPIVLSGDVETVAVEVGAANTSSGHWTTIKVVLRDATAALRK